ncbi:MAG: hypothetical protein V2A74_04080, partial [bacterium]
MNIQLYPIVHETSGTQPEARQGTALWPFFHWHKSENYFDWALCPLVSYQKNTRDGQNVEIHDFIWPFFRFRSKGSEPRPNEEKRFWFNPFAGWARTDYGTTRYWLFPLVYGRSEKSGPHYFILFPIVFYLRDARSVLPFILEGKQNATAVFPIWGHFERFVAVQDLRFFLWPLWVTSRQGEGRTYSVLWPIFGIFTGKDHSGFRIWPLVGHHRYTGHYDKWNYLWPLGYHMKTGLDTDDPRSASIFL